MGKRQKAYVLLIICVLMQVASAFPHHHHGSLFCLHSDAVCCKTFCECCENTFPDDNKEAHTCGTDCITHFQCASPDSHHLVLVPDYTSYTFIYPGTGDSCILSPDFILTAKELFCYSEALYSREIPRSLGLRAPPSLI